MKNPFIKELEDGSKYIESNCSINKVIVAKCPIEGYEYLEGLNAKKIFSTQSIVEVIKEKALQDNIDISEMYDAELPMYVERQFLDELGEFHKQACSIIEEFGYRLGIVLLTLRMGMEENRKAREDWNDKNWEYYANLKKIILVGGLANGEFGKQLCKYVEEVFKLAGAKPYDLVLYPNASYFGVLGCATKLNKKKSKNILFDFGQTNIKRAIVDIEDYKVKELHKLEHRPSWFMECNMEDEQIALEEAKKLHNNILTVIADTYTIASDKYKIDNDIVVSIASYVREGVLNNKRGGYAKLSLLADNYKELLERDLRKLLRRKINITLVHDGTAVALNFIGEKEAACMSIGTAFGIGFPEIL